jgi:ferric-dicitrate binding protein FerR (iron transport regulator)
MTSSDPNSNARIRVLALRQLDDSLTTAEHDELESLLLQNESPRRAYVEYFQDTACLRWLCLEELSCAIEPSKSLRPSAEPRHRRRRAWAFALVGGVACVVVLATAAMLLNSRKSSNKSLNRTNADLAANSGENPAISPNNASPAGNLPAAHSLNQVATMTGLGAVRWAQPTQGARLLSRWAIGDRLQLEDGAIELTFDAGAQVTIFGPADFEITSPTSIRCQRGRVTTLVGDRGKGFVIETPRAKVVDLGTQFGLSISDSGETEVVVFQGSVDMSYASPTGAANAPPRRLNQGEALLLNNEGEFQRVMSVLRNDFLTALDAPRRRPPEPVIANVQDNIRTAEGVKAYQIVRNGLEEDAPCFVDRSHQWNGIDRAGLPHFLLGADYVMPFNDDKFVHTLELKLELLRPAYLYVFLDNNMEVPEWVRKDFVDTGVDIGLDGSKTQWHQANSLAIGAGNSVDFPFSVWRRHVKTPGTVTLGSVNPPAIGTRSAGFNMYGVAAVAAD